MLPSLQHAHKPAADAAVDSPHMATFAHVGVVVEMRLAGVRLQEAADALQPAAACHLDLGWQQLHENQPLTVHVTNSMWNIIAVEI